KKGALPAKVRLTEVPFPFFSSFQSFSVWLACGLPAVKPATRICPGPTRKAGAFNEKPPPFKPVHSFARPFLHCTYMAPVPAATVGAEISIVATGNTQPLF